MFITLLTFSQSFKVTILTIYEKNEKHQRFKKIQAQMMSKVTRYFFYFLKIKVYLFFIPLISHDFSQELVLTFFI